MTIYEFEPVASVEDGFFTIGNQLFYLNSNTIYKVKATQTKPQNVSEMIWAAMKRRKELHDNKSNTRNH